MSEPIGPQYGLTPRQDHTPPTPVYDSADVLGNPYSYNDPISSEFGGVPGITQPAPHVPTGAERMRQIYAIDPADPGTGVAAPELEGAFQTTGTE